MVAAIHTTLVKRKSYSNDMPWQLHAVSPAALSRLKGVRHVDARLFHYLTAGTAREGEWLHARYQARRRQTRLFIFATLLIGLWLGGFFF